MTDAKHEAPAEGAGERERLADAYIAGAMSVHEYWTENPGEAPRGDPEFDEAAGDYAYSIHSDLRARSSAPEAQTADHAERSPSIAEVVESEVRSGVSFDHAELAAIISDAEIIRVHGHANFGPSITAREVVNEGVRKYAVGYHSGYTQLTILLEHGLITKPRPGRYDANLTKKGKKYARVLYRREAALLSEIAALRGVCDHANEHWKKTQTAWSGVLAATNCKDGGELVDLARRATQAERQRDELRKALEEIARATPTSTQSETAHDMAEWSHCRAVVALCAATSVANQGADQ